MATIHQIMRLTDDDGESITMAINAYNTKLWSRKATLEQIPLDALVFAEHQTPYISEAEYLEKRCVFDDETNEWLEHYVLKMAVSLALPPILVTLSETGIVLIDGVHRTSAMLMHTERTHIAAWIIQ